jgi:hypothetical protein
MTPRSSPLSTDAPPPTGPPSMPAFEIGAFSMVRQFVEHLVDKNAAATRADSESLPFDIDWDAVEAAVAGSRTLEQAVGRAVVIADQAARGLSEDYRLRRAPSWPKFEDPFFAFSMADVLPDFGDESRYRSKVRRKVAGLFGARRAVVGTTVVDPDDHTPASTLVGHDDRRLAS